MIVKRAFINKIKHSFYLKMLFFYSAIFLFASVAMTTFLLYSQKTNQLHEIEKNNQNILTQFQIYTDHYLLNPVYSFLNTELYSNTLIDSKLFFDDEAYRHNLNCFDNILDIHKSFSGICEDSDIIHSIQIYNKKYDTFLSTENGGYYSITNHRFDYRNLVPYQILDYIELKKEPQFWIAPAVTASFYPHQTMASLVQSLPVFSDPNHTSIILVINVDLAPIYQDFLSEINTDFNELMILDERDQIIYSTDSGRLTSNGLDTHVMENISTQPKGNCTYKAEKHTQSATWLTSSANQWKYIFLTTQPSLFHSVFASAGWVFLATLLVSIICFIRIYLLSNWLYRPIRQLLDYSSHASASESLQEGKDELSTLDAVFRNMNSHVEQLKLAVEKNNSLLINNTVKELINGNIHSLNELNEQLNVTGLNFPYQNFCLLCIKADESIYRELDYKKRTYLQIAVTDYLNNRSFDTLTMQTTAFCIFDYSGLFTCIINSDIIDTSLLDSLQNILDELASEYDHIFNMAVSSDFNDFSRFKPEHEAILSFFKYRYIYGNGNIFTKELIEEYESDAAIRIEAPLELLGIQIKKHDEAAIKKEIAALFLQSRERKNSLLYTYNLSLQIINLICSECENQGIHADSLAHPFLVDSFTKIQDLDTTVDWFFDVINDFISKYNALNTSFESSIIPSVIEYMNSHMDSQISLNTVADKFGLSTSHLSRLFKEKAGITFSDFLIHLKLETAVHLLLEDRCKKVSEIAEIMGYSNISHFNKLFKETYGMTPTQYRKMHFTP